MKDESVKSNSIHSASKLLQEFVYRSVFYFKKRLQFIYRFAYCCTKKLHFI